MDALAERHAGKRRGQRGGSRQFGLPTMVEWYGWETWIRTRTVRVRAECSMKYADTCWNVVKQSPSRILFKMNRLRRI